MSDKLGASVRILLLVLVFLGSTWMTAPSAMGCPGCQTQGEVVELQEPETVTASLALSWSVLFLLVVLGGVGTFLSVYIRKTVALVDAANLRR